MIASYADQGGAGIGLVLTTLPGPDRKRSRSLYKYQITYRAGDAGDAGCLMTWQVEGGREAYQIALERGERGEYRWHCTCADAVYRGELKDGHLCKHVRGLLECFPPLGAAEAANRRP